jgi:hypothetical protein
VIYISEKMARRILQASPIDESAQERRDTYPSAGIKQPECKAVMAYFVSYLPLNAAVLANASYGGN